MSFLRNQKVATKLWVMISPAILALIILCIQSGYNQNNILANSKEAFYEDVSKTSNLILNADRDYYHAAMIEKEEILSRDSLDEDKISTLIADFDEKVDLVLAEMREAYANLDNNPILRKEFKHSATSLSYTDLYDSFSIHFANWRATYDLETGIGDLDARATEFDKTRNDLKHMNELLDEYGGYITEQIQNSVKRNIMVSSIIIILIIIYITVVSVIIISYFQKNIKKLTLNMNALANNDLTFELHNVNSKDELGELSSSITIVIHSLKEILTKLNESSKKLANTSSIMRTNSNEVNVSINEIASTVGEIAESAGNQAEDTEHLVDELGSLGDVVKQNSKSADELSLASHQIKAVSNEGLKVVNQLDEITQKNQDSFHSIFEIINTTNDSAVKIGEASGLIAEIADQTNLLALNAAIEAARAGASGKGFSVIAEEIQKLSEQSTASTKVIDSMLKELTNNISNANIQSNVVKEAVLIQATSVNETKEKYFAIADTVDNINKEITALDSVSKKMEQSRSHIMDVVTNLSAIAQENAASTEETSATTEEVNASMAIINEVCEEVDNLVTELKTLIDRFIL